MILESIITTQSGDGSTNIAPMGPLIEPGATQFELRPFRGSMTLNNLSRHQQGVLHITDDVLVFAQSAIHQFVETPELFRAENIDGMVLANTCRWYEFRVTFMQTTEDRASINCEIVHEGRKRDFFGFNRAKHAIIEAAILATRVDFLPMGEIQEQFNRFGTIIGKTGGVAEQQAFGQLQNYVDSKQVQSNSHSKDHSNMSDS